jgi:hypothetical protein
MLKISKKTTFLVYWIKHKKLVIYEARTLLGLGVSVSDTCPCQCPTPTRHDTYNYTEFYHFFKLLSMSPYQCPCRIWCPCRCPCFIKSDWVFLKSRQLPRDKWLSSSNILDHYNMDVFPRYHICNHPILFNPCRLKLIVWK